MKEIAAYRNASDEDGSNDRIEITKDGECSDNNEEKGEPVRPALLPDEEYKLPAKTDMSNVKGVLNF